MAVIIERSLFRFTCTCYPCHLRSKSTPRKRSDPQHMTDEDTRVKFDVQAMCFDCCMVLVVGLSLSTNMFRCCHRCSVYVSSCLLSPAQHRFVQNCTHLQYHLEFMCVDRPAVVNGPSFSDTCRYPLQKTAKKSMAVVRRWWQPRCCHSQRHLDSCSMERPRRERQ